MASLVADVMTYNVVAVREDAEYKDIVAVMHRRNVSAFPVLGAHDMVIGVVSEADLLPHEAFPGGPGPAGGRTRKVPDKASALTAGELMSSPAITIGLRASVAEAARIMYDRKVKRLPVVNEHGSLVGIVSRVDLLGVYDREDADICDEINERVLAGDFVFDPREFEVTVTNGIVTITGRVARQDVAAGLLSAIWDVAGVVDVRDGLTYPVSRIITDADAGNLTARRSPGSPTARRSPGSPTARRSPGSGASPLPGTERRARS